MNILLAFRHGMEPSPEMAFPASSSTLDTFISGHRAVHKRLFYGFPEPSDFLEALPKKKKSTFLPQKHPSHQRSSLAGHE